jgi:hypothetical protein
MSLVETYRTWSEFRRKHPDRYVAGARRALDQVLEHLTTSTCACGNAAAVEGVGAISNALSDVRGSIQDRCAPGGSTGSSV